VEYKLCSDTGNWCCTRFGGPQATVGTQQAEEYRAWEGKQRHWSTERGRLTETREVQASWGIQRTRATEGTVGTSASSQEAQELLECGELASETHQDEYRDGAESWSMPLSTGLVECSDPAAHGHVVEWRELQERCALVKCGELVESTGVGLYRELG
jgi:hypothetical protein